MKNYKSLLIGFIPVVVGLFVYGGIFKSFYQQDEWQALGHVMTQGYGAFLSSYSLLDLITGQGRILSAPVHFSIYYFFPFNIFPFALFSISAHILNTVFSFILAKKLSKNNLISLITATFFAISSSADQAVVWVGGASTTTLPVAFLTFLAVILYLSFIKNNEKKYFWLSFTSAVTAMYFKESGLFLFILLPLLFLFSSKQTSKKRLINTVSTNWIFIVFLLAVSIIKINFLQSSMATGRFVGETGNANVKILYNTMLYPITSFSQTYINQGQFFSYASKFQRVFYAYLSKSDPNPLVAEFVVVDMLSILLTAIIMITMTVIFFVKKGYRKIILFGFLFTSLSFLPYVLIDKPNAYLEPRYYYVGLFGGGLLLGILTDFLLGIFKKRYIFIGYSVIFILLVAYFLSQISAVKKGIDNQINLAEERTNFLLSLKKNYPILPKKVVFYFSGNQDFNGQGNKVPFQQGPGYTLMVWYYKTGTIPREFLIEDFLWDMMSQGYKEKGNKGFGYFRTYEDLSREVEKNNLPVKNVLSFYYDAKNKKLIDISGDIHASLSAHPIIK